MNEFDYEFNHEIQNNLIPFKITDWADHLDDTWNIIFDGPAPKKVQRLSELSTSTQKSDDWLQRRHNYITGSAVADACGVKGPAARRNLLLEKVSYGEHRTFFGSRATHWGERFEPVANKIYSHRFDCKVYDFGLIPHTGHDFLAASTDGVTEHLIKNKYT